MKRVIPFPLFTLALLAMWLLLNQSVSAGHLLLGTLIALAAPHVLARLELPPTRFHHPVVIARLIGRVVVDIVQSNIEVAMIILQLERKGRRAGFVDIPLQLRSHYALATLACIVTATPGTLWAKYDPATGIMTLHVLDLIDERGWVEKIKGRYESLLMEIFE